MRQGADITTGIGCREAPEIGFIVATDVIASCVGITPSSGVDPMSTHKI